MEILTNKNTMKNAKAKRMKPKMSFATIGTIKSIDLSNRTFKLDPISKYRFEVKDGDENSWKIVFAEECLCERDPQGLRLVSKDTIFQFSKGLEGAMIVLKQSKAHVRIMGQFPEKVATRNKDQPVYVSINVL